VTFIYAGIQKLTDPGFFTLGAPTYIGTQIHGFARGSPIGSILLKLSEQAVAIGALTIVTEMAVGLLVLLGLFTRPAALTGLLLSFTFFLSASWNTTPYFYGSDIVFVMCWVTLILTGPGGFAFDPVAAVWLRDKVPAYALSWITGPLTPSRIYQVAVDQSEGSIPPPMARVSRGEILLGGAVAALLVYLGLVPRGRPHAGATAPSSVSSAASAPASKTSSSGAPAGTKKVANVSSLQPNSAIAVTDPKTGDPAAIVKLATGKIVCFDAVCTHAGCTVQYDPQYRVFVCPCHGGAFDPAQGGQVVSGPPPAPITQIPISIDSQGNAYIA
jgi:thiosulfate dehydrogenase [quinone] large subunit